MLLTMCAEWNGNEIVFTHFFPCVWNLSILKRQQQGAASSNKLGQPNEWWLSLPLFFRWWLQNICLQQLSKLVYLCPHNFYLQCNVFSPIWQNCTWQHIQEMTGENAILLFLWRRRFSKWIVSSLFHKFDPYNLQNAHKTELWVTQVPHKFKWKDLFFAFKLHHWMHCL